MKKFIIRKFNDLKLRNKLMISFIGVIFIPILIVGIFLTHELRKNAIKDALDVTTANVERVKKRTDDILKIPIYISNNLQFDSSLSQLANERYTSTFEVFEAYTNYQDFDYYQQTYPIVEDINFLMNNPTMLNNWSFIPVDRKMRDITWYREAVEANGLILWKYIPSITKNNNHHLSLIRKINFFDYKTYGILVIPININQLNWILDQETSPTYIVDDDNNIVASNIPELIGSKISGLFHSTSPVKEYPATIEGEVNGEASRITMDHLLIEGSDSSLRIVSVVSKKDIVKDANTLSMIGAIITLIAVIMAFFLIMGVSWLLSKRLSHLSTQIQSVGSGNLHTKLDVDGNDEIGQLSFQFNQMVESISQLINQVEETTRQKNLIENQQNEMKFKMLASQINPHFLFNTLESIRMKSHMNGEKEIANIVKLLGKLMRRSIETEGRKIRVKEELEVVQYYLEIQKFRFGDRLDFSLHIENRMENGLIYPLLIQPLVENAVIHGLEGIESGGCVTVEVIKQGKSIQMKIKDNGAGISTQKLQEIKKTLEDKVEKEGVRIGLRNVHQRLILTYGDDSGLRIDSLEGNGTSVTFTIPWEE